MRGGGPLVVPMLNPSTVSLRETKDHQDQDKRDLYPAGGGAGAKAIHVAAGGGG